ncbi:MAG: glycosyltransferase [bacterium]
MKLVVVIVNYKTPDMTIDSAKATLNELDHLDAPWRLVIVDNDSQDGSFEKIKNKVSEFKVVGGLDWGRVEVLDSAHNGGFGAGNNFGIRKYLSDDTTPEYFYILNSDAFPEVNSIDFLVEYLDSNPQAGVVGSYIHGIEGDPHVTAFRFPTIWGEFEGSVRFGVISRLLKNYVVPIGIPESTQPVDWLAGASMMIRSEVLKEVGLFDEDYFLYFEETDFCYRARKAGWKTVYVKESSVSHIGSVSTGMKEWKRIPKYWLDSRRHYFSKNHGLLYYYASTIVRITGELVWNVRVRLEKKNDLNPSGFVIDLFRHTIGIYSALKEPN